MIAEATEIVNICIKIIGYFSIFALMTLESKNSNLIQESSVDVDVTYMETIISRGH